MRASLGRGSQDNGGAPSTADGHLFAMGNSEEHFRKRVFGLKGIGQRADSNGSPTPPLDRTKGVGYVAPCKGDYTAAIALGWSVSLFVTESTGAISRAGLKLIGYLHSVVRKPGARDGTRYGSSRFATKSFKTHHISSISSALVHADAETIERRAADGALDLTLSPDHHFSPLPRAGTPHSPITPGGARADTA